MIFIAIPAVSAGAGNAALILASAAGDATDVSSHDASTIMDTVTTIVKSTFDLATSAFEFVLGNGLCMIVLGVGFAYTALGLVRRAVRAAKIR